MNNTKWDELRLAMHRLGKDSPKWRTRTVGYGYVSEWDGDWFYHFCAGGYADIEWLEIRTGSPEQHECMLTLLRQIHLPGHHTDQGFKVYGYAVADQEVAYL